MAIYLGEADAEAMFQAIVADDDPVIAAPSKFEFLMVACGRKADGSNAAQLLDSLAIATHAWTDAHAEGALEVFLRYGSETPAYASQHRNTVLGTQISLGLKGTY